MKNIVNDRVRQRQTKFKFNDGGLRTDGSVIINKFDDFFINIDPNLAAKIPDENLSPNDFMGQPLTNSIFLSEVTSGEIHIIIKSLKMGPLDLMKLMHQVCSWRCFVLIKSSGS